MIDHLSPITKAIALSLFIFLFSCQTSISQESTTINKQTEKQWVDSVFKTLSNKEKIGQLFMAQVFADGEHLNNINKTKELIKNYGIGGVIFMKSRPDSLQSRVSAFQKLSKVPIIMATDAEWGIGMRMKETTLSYPYQMTLGALENDSLIYQMGEEIAEQFKILGLNFNFAPSVDVNNNAKNPVISYRSFGENPQLVANKGLAYFKGMQNNGILVTAKHFPGHGDTATDSHYGLPVIPHSKERLQKVELFPFKQMIENDISGVMIAHMNIPVLDNRAGVPSTFSEKIIDSLLVQNMGFNGLIVSDAMNMGAITKSFDIGEADVRAIKAGMDIIEITTDIPKAIKAVEKAIQSGRLSMKRIEKSVLKILKAKYKAGLNQKLSLDKKDLIARLNDEKYKTTIEQLAEETLTVLNNENDLLPLQNLDEKTLIISFNRKGTKTKFQELGLKYLNPKNCQVISLPAKASADQIKSLKTSSEKFERVIIGMHQVNRRPGNYDGYSKETVSFIEHQAARDQTVVVYFRNPYTFDQFPGIFKTPGLILAYQGDDAFQSKAIQLIMGANDSKGKLPVTINKDYPFGHGIKIKNIGRTSYGALYKNGFDQEKLKKKIDSLVNQAIDLKGTPGAVVLIAKNNRVIYERAYGTLTHIDTTKVSVNHLYDLASITKVSSALPALMKLQSEGKFDLDKTLGDYLPYFKGSNKGNMTMRNILSHQAGLHPWIPYYKYTIKGQKNGVGKKKPTTKPNGKYARKTFRNKPHKNYPFQVASNLYVHKNFKQKIYRSIRDIENRETTDYKYSGLAFYLLPEIVEKISGMNFETYLYKEIFEPIGAYSLKYNPLKHFNKEQIAPTEYDTYFRKQLLHGTVDDEGAALMNGVSANAGLFSTANDLMKLCQLYLNNGNYAGESIIKPEVVEEYTRYQFKENNNRRGLGFDKPLFKFDPNGNASKYASEESFGHTGYTGTRLWIDPKENLVYIFLCNRLNPTRDSRMLYRLNTRTEVEAAIYESLNHSKQL